MGEDVFKAIRDENLDKHGTYGPDTVVFFSNLYSEKTHFIYELLQNAEDACSRNKSRDIEFYVRISLFVDRLEFRHNGEPFNKRDIQGICSYLDSTKNEENSQIGKFGIGFKSVYNYTKTPEIHSGFYSFVIRNYLYPENIQKRTNQNSNETLIIIRFDKTEPNTQSAFEQIKKKLETLEPTVLLFLRKISTIKVDIEDFTVDHVKKILEIYGSSRKVSVESNDEKENWIIFSKTLNNQFDKEIQIAFRLEMSAENVYHVAEISGARLYNYFVTDKPTSLKFLINGPFNSTPARDNIDHDDKMNSLIIEELTNLMVDSFETLKSMKLFNLDFLNMMPIHSIKAKEDQEIYGRFYEKFLNTLKNGEYLPSDEGFVGIASAYIPRNEELSDLIDNNQLRTLTYNDTALWMSKDISTVKYSTLKNFLTFDLQIKELRPEDIIRQMDEYFFESQSDSWFIRFYTYIQKLPNLWTKKAPDPILLKKNFIRTSDDSHIAPFDHNGNPTVFIPEETLDPQIQKKFKFVKRLLWKDEKSQTFLKVLGLHKLDKKSVIINKVLPSYKEHKDKIRVGDNLTHIEWIYEAINDEDLNLSNQNFITLIKNTPLLLARNAFNATKEFIEPAKIHLPKSYTKENILEIYFEGNNDKWFLDDIYLENKNLNAEFFKLIGCKDDIEITTKKPDKNGYVEICSQWGNNVRGANDFYSDSEMEGLEFAVQNINVEKAAIIWNLLTRNYKLIRGYIESSKKKDFSNSTKNLTFSKMGKILYDSIWVPDQSGEFHRPSDEKLTSLNENIDTDSKESEWVAEKLDMKLEINRNFINNIADELDSLPEEQKYELEQLIIKLIQNHKGRFNQYNSTNVISSKETVPAKFLTNLNPGTTRESDQREEVRWNSTESSEDEKTIKEYGGHVFENVDKSDLKYKDKVVHERLDETLESKPFLIAEYNGHCQVCNIRLDVGDNREPIISTYRIIKKSDMFEISNAEFNVLSLCPNCHALALNGGLGIPNLEHHYLEKIRKKEILAEPVSERNGDYYILEVVLAGKRKEIYISKSHMNRILSVSGIGDSE
jgi:hypothetical protein